MADEFEEKISELAGQPKSYEIDGEKMENHPLPDVIEAAKYLGRKRAGRNPFAAVKIARISTQGAEK